MPCLPGSSVSFSRKFGFWTSVTVAVPILLLILIPVPVGTRPQVVHPVFGSFLRYRVRIYIYMNIYVYIYEYIYIYEYMSVACKVPRADQQAMGFAELRLQSCNGFPES